MKPVDIEDMKSRSIPFDFIFEELAEMAPETKMMFGCHAMYIEGKIIFILRDRDQPRKDDGIWLATTTEHHASLQTEFPNMRSISIFGPEPTGWQVLPAESDDFESAALRACELVIARDPRIGKIPKARLSKGKRGKAPGKKSRRR